jgi:uncharacterized protein DUF6627
MSQFRRFLAASLIVSMTAAGLPLPAQAGMLPSDTAIAGASAARDHIASLLERADVRQQLETLGVNPADVKARVAALTDDEAAQLAARIDQLPTGADAGGALLGALVLIFIVLLITDILGVTHVFPFTRPISR